LLGGAVARSLNLDLFGYVVIGTVSGLGGGVLRDTLLQHGPPIALTNAWYLPTALAGAAVAFLVKYSEDQWHRFLLFYPLDAMAISAWAVAGAQKTTAVGLGWLAAVMLGTITAVGGGAVRDLLVQRTPAVLGGNGLYASVAIVVAGIQVLFTSLGHHPLVGTIVGLVVGTLLRVGAVRWGWSLPAGMPWEARDVIGKVTPMSLSARSRGPLPAWPWGKADSDGEDDDDA
jgi:uncharacterized membrane protein YeiH